MTVLAPRYAAIYCRVSTSGQRGKGQLVRDARGVLPGVCGRAWVCGR